MFGMTAAEADLIVGSWYYLIVDWWLLRLADRRVRAYVSESL
jgi:hypothetical protein